MKTDRALVLLLAGVLFALTVALVLPFLQYFLLAAVLAYALTPLQKRLTSRLSPRQAATVLVFASAVMVLLPLVIVARATAAEAVALLTAVRDGELTFDAFEEPLRRLTGVEIDLVGLFRQATREVGTGAVSSLFDVFGLISHALFGLGLTLFLLFYFLKDRERFWGWLRRTTPLPERLQTDLYGRIDDITRAVLAGHVLVAIVQGTVAGIGLFVVGIPSALFWTAVMVVLSLLPIIGSFLVWGPAAIYLFVTGEQLGAAFLLLYGTIVVGVTDDYLRPIVVDRYAQVNPSVIIVGVLGGVYVIGFMGLFVGPIVVGALRATLDVYREEFVRPGG